jgi:hypothetical protein
MSISALKESLANQLTTWSYGSFTFESPEDVPEIKKQLRAGYSLLPQRANTSMVSTLPKVKVQFKGDWFTIVLAQEYNKRALASVYAIGSIQSNRSGATISVKIGQSETRLYLLFGVAVAWLLFAIVTPVMVVVSESFKDYVMYIMMLGILSLMLRTAIPFTTATVDETVGPDTLAFLKAALKTSELVEASLSDSTRVWAFELSEI